MSHSQQSSSMSGGILFSIYPEESDEASEEDSPDPTSQEDAVPTASLNVLKAALPSETPSPDEPAPPDEKSDDDLFVRFRTMLLDEELSPSEKIQRLLELGVQRLDVEGGYLNRIDRTEGSHRTIAVAGAHPDDASAARDLSVTYCRRVVAEGKALAVEHAEEQGWTEDPAYETFGFSTYLGAQVHSHGEMSGTVCFTDHQPRDVSFDDEEATLLALIARAIGQLLEQQPPEERS